MLNGSLVTELCALARRYLARSEEEFAQAVADGDYRQADVTAGEAAQLHEALERQERADG